MNHKSWFGKPRFWQYESKYHCWVSLLKNWFYLRLRISMIPAASMLNAFSPVIQSYDSYVTLIHNEWSIVWALINHVNSFSFWRKGIIIHNILFLRYSLNQIATFSLVMLVLESVGCACEILQICNQLWDCDTEEVWCQNSLQMAWKGVSDNIFEYNYLDLLWH